MNVLYLIPARGGSKGIPGKNIKELAGKPLIYYSIDVARQFASDMDICVSSDSLEIISKVKNYGLNVPFVRPRKLATDKANSDDVIMHALNYYMQKGLIYDCIVLLQPTSPFRKAEDVKEAFKLYNDEIDMVVSVKEADANPYYSLFEEDENGFLMQSKPGNYSRRQDCPKVWQYNGALYLINAKSFKHKESLNKFTKIVKYVMDDYSSLDLDTQLNWDFCEYLIQANKIN